jgi:hypothetical protein
MQNAQGKARASLQACCPNANGEEVMVKDEPTVGVNSQVPANSYVAAAGRRTDTAALRHLGNTP